MGPDSLGSLPGNLVGKQNQIETGFTRLVKP